MQVDLKGDFMKARPDIYTVLAFITCVFLGVGIALLWQANTTLTGDAGQGNPWHILESPTKGG